mmetsp:Transcript_16961/g.27048  ORF Transcript_16961/g.27048 Transcript_16961/m.27048 type:complete len:237 (+) Transcript_16961:83-793(+)
MFPATRATIMSRRLLRKGMRANYTGTNGNLFSSSIEAAHAIGGRMGGPLSSKQPLENTFETFRKESGAAIGDLTSYVSSWLNDNPLGEIHIGADSKSVEGVIIFAVAVCLYQKSEGGHVLYKKLKVPYQGSRKNLVHCRLLEECSQALAVADELNASFKSEKITVHIDCNPEVVVASSTIVYFDLAKAKSPFYSSFHSFGPHRKQRRFGVVYMIAAYPRTHFRGCAGPALYIFSLF